MKTIVVIITVVLYCGFLKAQSSLISNSQAPSKKSILLEANNNLLQSPLSLKLHNVHVKEVDPLETQLNYGILAGVGTIFLGTGIGVHIYQRNAWWSSERTSFHFQNDWSYALWLDKVGHFYAATILAHAFTSGLAAGNMQSDDAAIYGSILGLAFQLYVEVEDGFGAQWGFSPGDAYADILGSGYTLSQYFFPFLKNYQFKFSYYPSLKMREGLHKGIAIDDDEGQKYWLSFRMKNLLPEKIASYWPSFLCLAAGMGVQNLDGNGGGQRVLYIALDFDAESIPLYGKGWEFIKNTLNYIHFPMPGIRITPNAAFFGFVF